MTKKRNLALPDLTVNSPEGATVVLRDGRRTSRARGSLTTHRWQQKFLRTLRKTPSVKHACLAAGVSRSSAYRQRDADTVFAERWDSAIAESVDEIQRVCFQRATEGDANLIMFLLRCHRPEVYRDVARRELTGADGRPLAGKIIFLPAKGEGDE
jgi:hypothetical protein